MSCSHLYFVINHIKIKIQDDLIEILQNDVWKNGRSNYLT